MYAATVDPPWDGAAWRTLARAALRAGVEPAAIAWEGDTQAGLLAGVDVATLPPRGPSPRVSGEFLTLADAVLCHRDPQRHALLYRLLWRLAHGESNLLDRATDADVRRAAELDKAVRRDTHKMKAFVRFREVPGERDRFIAWFEPDHFIVDRVAPFFQKRFAGMRWAIVTPYRHVAWDGEALAFGPGGVRADAPADDAREDLWRTYYAHIFNPARINPRMMRQEMPQKYWKHLPETALLPTLLRDAGQRVQAMADRTPELPRRRIPVPAPKPLPPRGDLAAARAAARDCRDCELWQPATQVVFGEGPADARILVVGEQPGDEEDLTGRPFVGPSGRLFSGLLDELGLDRGGFYVTNAVKHFRFEQRGKHRLHRNPEARHVAACRQWLALELAAVRPRAIVCLGATAARAVLGGGFRLMDNRGQWQVLRNGTRVLPTTHPSWVLRQRGDAARDAALAALRDDLRRLHELEGDA